MAKLYEISDQIEALLFQAIDRETGEIKSEEAERELDNLVIDFQAKALNVAKFARGEIAEAEAIEAAAKKNLERAKQHRRHAEWLMGYLTSHLKLQGLWVDPGTHKAAGQSKILKDPEIQIYVQHGVAAEPADPLDPKAPPEFCEEVPATTKIKLGEILKALKAGQEVPGWNLSYSEALKAK